MCAGTTGGGGSAPITPAARPLQASAASPGSSLVGGLIPFRLLLGQTSGQPCHGLGAFAYDVANPLRGRRCRATCSFSATMSA